MTWAGFRYLLAGTIVLKPAHTLFETMEAQNNYVYTRCTLRGGIRGSYAQRAPYTDDPHKLAAYANQQKIKVQTPGELRVRDTANWWAGLLPSSMRLLVVSR